MRRRLTLLPGGSAEQRGRQLRRVAGAARWGTLRRTRRAGADTRKGRSACLEPTSRRRTFSCYPFRG